MSTLSELVQIELSALYEAIADVQRQLNELREAKNRMIMVGECINVEGNRCELGFGKIEDVWRQRSGLVPWLGRAGEDYQTYQAPSIGEQGLLLNIGEADALNAGVALFGIRSDTNPLPTTDSSKMVFNFKDGIELTIDRNNGSTSLAFATKELNIGGLDTMTIDANNIQVSGKLTVNDLESEKEVKDSKRTMSQIVDVYNNHTHTAQGAAPPSGQIP